MISVIQQNFLSPIGLSALLALIPLIIFYLVKPKPDREIMPSMKFFAEEKQKGKIKNALNKLKRNKFLLLHILFILLAASAIANPLITGLESEGDSVIILDTSASMNDNRQQVENFALKHLGERNTVITVGNTVEIQNTDASPEQARRTIRNHENTASSTDLVPALQIASNHPGKMVIASDMDHTGNGNLENLLENLASERTVKAMDVDHENSHAFTNLEVNGQEAEVTVQNFLNQNNTVTMQKPGENIRRTLRPQSTETINVELEPGTHELNLPNDELAIDNKLYVSIPKDDKIAVKRLGRENRYFTKAIELINQTTYESGNTLEGADTYYISQNYDLSGKEERIEQLLNQGSPVILEPRNDLPDTAPVENMTDSRETRVQIERQMTTSFTSNVTGYDITGRSLSQPQEAIVLSEDNRLLLYNVEDENFGKKITYPIFWKNILLEMTNRKTANDINIKTGQRRNFPEPVTNEGTEFQGSTKIQDTGFYKGEETYAANLIDAEESAPHINKAPQNEQITNTPGKDPARKYMTSALALLTLFELIYLSKTGAI